MTNRKSLSLLVSLLLLPYLLSCNSKQEQILRFWEKTAEITEKNKNNCTQMAIDLNKHIDPNIETISKLMLELDKKDDKKLADKRLQNSMTLIMQNAQKCMNDPNFQESFAKLIDIGE